MDYESAAHQGLTQDEAVELQNSNNDDLENWLEFDETTAIYNLLVNEDEF